MIAVVGAGVMGLAAARALAREGHAVVVYEQCQVGHTRGSSHGRSRIVRLAYPDVEFVRLAEESMRGWRELEAESELLLELYGLLELVGDAAQSSEYALEACGVEHELLSAEEARARWPIGVPENWTVLVQPEAGIVRADLALKALLDSAARHGAELREGTRVESLVDVQADAVVVTAGAWGRDLLAPSGIELPVRATRETLAYFRRDAEPLPSIVQLDPATRGHAMYSLRDPRHGLKVGVHHAGIETDPDDPGEPDADLLARISEWVARTYPDADPEPVEAETCLYTNTADESFVLERHGRIVVGSACSGHGFKFAPAIGDRLAALAVEALA